MKLFANKSMWKKIVIIFLVINIFTFIAPKPVAAGFGGALMKPVCDFLVWTGDGIVNIVHRVLVHQNDTLIKVDLNDGIMAAFRILAAVIVGIVIIALVCAGGYAFITAILTYLSQTWTFALAASFASVICIGLVGGIYTGAQVYSADFWDNEVHIPLFSITPEEIFKGDVKLFSVDFFDSNPGESESVPYSFIETNFDDLEY